MYWQFLFLKHDPFETLLKSSRCVLICYNLIRTVLQTLSPPVENCWIFIYFILIAFEFLEALSHTCTIQEYIKDMERRDIPILKLPLSVTFFFYSIPLSIINDSCNKGKTIYVWVANIFYFFQTFSPYVSTALCHSPVLWNVLYISCLTFIIVNSRNVSLIKPISPLFKVRTFLGKLKRNPWNVTLKQK